MALRSREVGTYGSREQVFAERLASQIAPAVANAELYQQLQASTEEMEVVDKVARIITSTLDVDQVFESFVQELKMVVNFDRCTINTINSEDYTYSLRYIYGQARSDRPLASVTTLKGSIAEQVFLTQQTVVREDITDDPKYPVDGPVGQAGMRGNIVTPMIYGAPR